MELTKCNQLKIDENDILHDERYSCPSCGSELYSSVLMEKITSKSSMANTISLDSLTGIDRVIYCKCSCGETWIEKYSPSHHRPLIRDRVMYNYSEFGAAWDQSFYKQLLEMRKGI